MQGPQLSCKATASPVIILSGPYHSSTDDLHSQETLITITLASPAPHPQDLSERPLHHHLETLTPLALPFTSPLDPTDLDKI